MGQEGTLHRQSQYGHSCISIFILLLVAPMNVAASEDKFGNLSWFKRASSPNPGGVQVSEWFPGSCDDLRFILEKQILASDYQQIDVRDPHVTRWHLGMALKWAEKELSLLQARYSELVAVSETASPQQQVMSGQQSVGDKSCVLPVSAVCKTDMVLVNPRDNAHFEQAASGGNAPRLDGIKVGGLHIEDKVKVYLCMDSETAGRFVVQKCIGCRANVSFSFDQDYVTASQRIGPDEINMVLEGPEILDLFATQKHHGACTYEFPFNVTIPGQYHLSMVLQRENWEGLNELKKRWPPAHYDQPVGSDIWFAVGPGSLSNSSLQRIQQDRGLPQCQLRPPQTGAVEAAWYGVYWSGRWVTTSFEPHASVFSAEQKLQLKRSNSRKRYGFERTPPAVDVKLYRWHPYNCRVKSFSPEQARSCIRGKTIEFRGDSHMRTLFNAMMKYACNAKEQGNWHQSFCHRPSGFCSGEAFKKICVKNDDMGAAKDALGCLKTGCGQGIVVANFGHHPADGEHQWTYGKYRARVNEYVQKLRDVPRERLRGQFLWMQSNFMPFRKDNWIQGYKDWRTASRLSVWNAYADSKMMELGVGIIPTFSQTASVSHLQHDTAHFELPVLYQSSVLHILNFLCPAQD